MALLSGSAGLGNQLGKMAAQLSFAPGKITQSVSPFAQGDSFDPGSSFYSTPAKMDFGSVQQSVFDPTSGHLSKFNPASLFGAPAMGAVPGQQQPTGTVPGAVPGVVGGDWAGVEQWNGQIGAAAAKYGVPANLIKAVMKLESDGQNLSRNGAGAIGPMQVVDTYWGNIGYDLYDPGQNIMAGAYVLKQNYDQWSGWAQQNGVDPWEAALYGYYAGSPYDLSSHDNPSEGGSGMSTGAYGAQIWQSYQNLNTLGGGSVGAGTGYNPGSYGDAHGQNIVSIAQQYLGTPYVWGAIPGKGEDPRGGWDCSGFTYWLDQNYGNGQLPMGSHYQYQYAADNGMLFNDTGQLRAGDLIFFDTGDRSGGGAEMNGASHVAMYIGNGQIIHAANPSVGTIISNLNDGYYMQRFIGAMHSSFGSAGTAGMGTPGTTQGQPAYQQPQTFAQGIRAFNNRTW